MKELDTLVNASEKDTENSRKAQELSVNAEQSIAKILSYLHEIASATQDLAAVSQQQAASSEEITASVQEIAFKANDTSKAGESFKENIKGIAETTGQISHGAEEIVSIADDLQDKLSFFSHHHVEETEKTKPASARALPSKNSAKRK